MIGTTGNYSKSVAARADQSQQISVFTYQLTRICHTTLRDNQDNRTAQLVSSSMITQITYLHGAS